MLRRMQRTGRDRNAIIGAAAAGALTCAGCSAPGTIFPEPPASLRWPAEPDEARIRYVGQITSDKDLKPGRNFGQNLGEMLFGKDPARTMLSPLAVCTDGHDRVFVADSNDQLVHVFDLARRRYEQWRPPKDQAPLSQPVAVAFDPAGRLLVSDPVAGVLVVFDGQGRYLGTLGERALKRPCGVAVDSAGRRLFVADAGAHQVVVLSADGEELSRIGQRGSEPGQFNFPTNVVLDRQGRLYVSDSLNFRVQVFDADLKPVRQIGRKGDLPGYFSQPKGIALDAEDHLYVVDANFEAVQVFDSEGRLLMAFGHEGHGPGEFWLPAGINVDPNGRIWIADSYNRRIQVFDYLPKGAQP